MVPAIKKEQWTTAMSRAVSYVESAISREMGPTAALREYRTGGGEIRTQDWFALYAEERATTDKGSLIPKLPESSTIPEDWHTERPWNYQNNYNTIIRATMYDRDNLPIGDFFATIGSETRLTWGEIRKEFDEVIRKEAYGLAMQTYSITGVTAVRRS